MEHLKAREIKAKKAKFKLALISVTMTIVFLLLVIIILGVIFSNNKPNNYIVPNSYSFSGNILNVTQLNSDITLVIEKKDSTICAITLRNNELISQKALSENLDDSEIKDFSVALDEYDNNKKSKEFVYVNLKDENEYIYNFYSVDNIGNITDMDIEPIKLDAKNASVKLEKVNDKYQYYKPIFYYDGYKVVAEVGEYELNEKWQQEKKTITKKSKISIDGRYNATPRKVQVLDEIPQYFLNVNDYLLEGENRECIEVDLDGDKQKEYIISFAKDNKTNVALFDSSANDISNLLRKEGIISLSESVEIADIDNDGVMEIVVINENIIEVHRYNNGFFY